MRCCTGIGGTSLECCAYREFAALIGRFSYRASRHSLWLSDDSIRMPVPCDLCIKEVRS